MKKLILIIILLFLASCSIDSKSNYSPVEKEYPQSNSITYEYRDEFTKTYNSTELIFKNYWVINPTSEANLDVTVIQPIEEKTYEAIILVPGGRGNKNDFMKDSIAEKFAAEGYIVVIFSPDSRGDSEGTEDYNGYIAQDGLYEIYRFTKHYNNVNSVGIISYSYGIALASGMLGRYQPEANFYIEWEGPVSRYYVTVGCKPAGEDSATKEGITCTDDNYWAEREALRFVPYFDVKYFLIVQDNNDHVQDTYQHSLEINNLAIQYLPWVRVNGPENEINTKYIYEDFPGANEEIVFNDNIISYVKEFT